MVVQQRAALGGSISLRGRGRIIVVSPSVGQLAPDSFPSASRTGSPVFSRRSWAAFSSSSFMPIWSTSRWTCLACSSRSALMRDSRSRDSRLPDPRLGDRSWPAREPVPAHHYHLRIRESRQDHQVWPCRNSSPIRQCLTRREPATPPRANARADLSEIERRPAWASSQCHYPYSSGRSGADQREREH